VHRFDTRQPGPAAATPGIRLGFNGQGKEAP
jgi:hypothetical protein